MCADSDYRHFEIPGAATFAPGPGLPRLRIRTAQAQAELFLHGAHLTQFQPAGAEPVIFVSQRSQFEPGTAIRGGVPICFPWFGPRDGNPKLSMHGFARTRAWEIESVRGATERSVTVSLRFVSDEATRALWPHDFVARLVVEISAELVMTLEVENTSMTPFQFEAALHTYFSVSDVRKVSVTGLENARYIDKADGFAHKQLGSAPLRFTAETDRVFPGSTGACIIHDPGLDREIVIEKRGSSTTVVWNPWEAKAAAMTDLGDDEWPRMLCIETANTGDDAITLAPGGKHALSQIVRV